MSDRLTELAGQSEPETLAELAALAITRGRPIQALAILEGANDALALFVAPETGSTLLHVACQAGDQACVEKLLAMGADPLARTTPRQQKAPLSLPEQSTPLMIAAKQGHLGCVQALIDHAEDAAALTALFSTADALGRSPMIAASANGHAQTLAAMLRAFPQGAKAADPSGKTAAMWACMGNHLECLKLLDAAESKSNAPYGLADVHGFGALTHATLMRSHHCVDFLARRARELLEEPSERARQAAARILGASMPQIHLRPLAYAVTQRDEKAFDLLVEPSLRLGLPADKLALIDACDRGRSPAIDQRLAALRELVVEQKKAQDLLLRANVAHAFRQYRRAMKGDPRAPGRGIKRLDFDASLAQALDLAPKSTRLAFCSLADKTLWRVAVEARDAKAIEVFSKRLGAQTSALGVNVAGLDGLAPLALAARWDHWACCEALLAAGAKISQPDFNGATPLDHAMERGHFAVAARLRAAGGLEGKPSAEPKNHLPRRAIDLHADVAKLARIMAAARQAMERPASSRRAKP